ncbi:MAG: hypothetical protein P8N14_11195 [Sulfitobacter sp.]|nr:hypothetical protein [Sulfitobacter sp.]
MGTGRGGHRRIISIIDATVSGPRASAACQKKQA